jgi:hypothetical protein
MGNDARSGNAATMGVQQLEDFACLLWVVTAHGVCLLLWSRAPRATRRASWGLVFFEVIQAGS